MSTTINSTLNGKFIVEDIHGNVLSEEHNIITNWGMTRLTNFNKQFSNDYMRCLSDNFKRIFPGTSGTAAQASDYKLGARVLPANYDHFNEPSITKTTYSREAGTDNLIIQIVKGSRLEFKNSNQIEIKELGIGFNYDDNPDHTYKSGNFVNSTSPYSPTPGVIVNQTNNYIGTTFLVPPYTDHADNIDFSLWSRSVIPGVFVVSGDILIVKYVLTINTNCDKVQSNWTFDSGSAGAVAMPSRKSNVRRKPFYELLSGTPKVVVGNVITSWGYVPTENGGRWGQDGGNQLTNANGLLSILPTLEQPYLGRNELHLYTNYNTQLFANFPGIESSPSNPTTYPAATALNATLDAVYCNSGVNQNYITNKLRHSYRTLSATNTVVCQHRFLFNPGEWPTLTNSFGQEVFNFSFVRFNSDYVASASNYTSNPIYTGALRLQPSDSDVHKCGVFTSLSAVYDPYANDAAMYVGLDYTFTFNRI